MKEIYIDTGNSGGRLDKLIFKYLDKAPSGFVYKMLRKKNITLNGAKAEGSAILKKGDVVRLYLSDDTVKKFRSGGSMPGRKNAPALQGVQESVNLPEFQEAQRRKNVPVLQDVKELRNAPELQNMQGHRSAPVLQIVYEDDNICAACKPAGLLSQKAKPDDISANDFFLEHIKSDEFFKPGIQNRLDRNTSGIVLSGKNPAAARELSRIIRERSAIKKYLCPVCGNFEKEQTLEAWLVKDTKKNKVRLFSQPQSGGAHILTGCRPLRSNGMFTLIEAELITGKSHQIRAHLADTGYPIVGDTKYGNKKLNEYARRQYGVKYQLLHAFSFEIEGAQGILEYLNGTTIRASLPEKFSGFLRGENLWEPGDPEV